MYVIMSFLSGDLNASVLKSIYNIPDIYFFLFWCVYTYYIASVHNRTNESSLVWVWILPILLMYTSVAS